MKELVVCHGMDNAKHEGTSLTGCWAESLRVVGEKQQADRTLVSAGEGSHCDESLITRVYSVQFIVRRLDQMTSGKDFPKGGWVFLHCHS